MANKLRLSKTCAEVVCDRNDVATQELLTSFYPVTSNRTKTSFKLSPYYIPELLETFRGINSTNISTAPLAIQDLWYAETQRRSAMADLLANGPKQSPIVSDRLTLSTSQQLGREIAKLYPKYAFFYDTRTGKTPMSLTIIHDDIVEHPGHKWLVVCPLILIYNAWLEDCTKFFPDMAVVNCHASSPGARLLAIDTPANLYLTNTESYINYKEYFDKIGLHGVCVDESSDMKSPKAKVSAALVQTAQEVSRFYLLSGTPAPNGEHEYYMQMKAVDYFGWPSSNTKFKEYFFVNLSYNPQFEKLAVRPDRKEALMAAIKHYAMFVDKEEALNTPGREFIVLDYDMPDDLMAHYRKLKNELYVELTDELKITAPSAAAKLNKLNQVSSGFIIDTRAVKENQFYDTNKQEWYLLNDYRFNFLQNFLSRPDLKDEQIIIWANYRREFEIIQERLRSACRCVFGGLNIETKNAAISDFKSGQAQYLIANPASADKGLTLTNAHIAVYFSLNWSYELFKQSMDRIYGDIKIQPKKCLYYVIIANHTVDRIIYEDVLQGKQTTSYAVLNHLKPEVALK